MHMVRSQISCSCSFNKMHNTIPGEFDWIYCRVSEIFQANCCGILLHLWIKKQEHLTRFFEKQHFTNFFPKRLLLSSHGTTTLYLQNYNYIITNWLLSEWRLNEARNVFDHYWWSIFIQKITAVDIEWSHYDFIYGLHIIFLSIYLCLILIHILQTKDGNCFKTRQ